MQKGGGGGGGRWGGWQKRQKTLKNSKKGDKARFKGALSVKGAFFMGGRHLHLCTVVQSLLNETAPTTWEEYKECHCILADT